MVKDSFEPIFEETFTLPIVRGDDPLVVKVFEKDFLNRVNGLGSVFISLQDYRDQRKVEDWFKIKKKAKIRLSIQFIHSRVRAIDMKIMEEDQRMKNFEMIKRASEEELAKMREPFWFMDDGEDEKTVPFLLGPFYHVHTKEQKMS